MCNTLTVCSYSGFTDGGTEAQKITSHVRQHKGLVTKLLLSAPVSYEKAALFYFFRIIHI